MQRRMASAAGLDLDRVNVKATTTEGLDATGEGLGIAATAVVLLQAREGAY
jgi:2-C-methyl-D-erythritol 2,4-cyclodiphosphate synthase